MIQQEILHFHVCGGAGGGAKGFNRGQARVGHVVAKPRCIGGVDVDPAGIADFNRVAGAPGTILDLFTAEQFAAFHGRVPPAGWREATPQDFQRAAGGERPNVVFMSTPCKGFSGLLSDKLSTSAKYQALNGLTLRAVWLTLEAWQDDPPEFILFENVPRIATRGRWLLDQIGALLAAYGYVFAETQHDCGVLGVRRWNETAGTVTGRGSPTTGTFAVADPRIDGHERSVQMGVRAWGSPAGTVTGNMAVGAGPNAVADPRLHGKPRFNNVYRIVPWGAHAPAVAGPGGPGGGLAVADPRAGAGFGGAGKYRVTGYAEAAGTVIGASTTGQGAFALADPRPAGAWRDQTLGVLPFDEPAGAITAQAEATTGRFSVADPRCTWADTAHRNKLKVVPYEGAAGTVTGADRVGSGALCVADPRPRGLNAETRDVYRTGGHYGVTPWEKPAGAIPGFAKNNNGPWSVADPRAAVGDEAEALPAPDDRLVAVIQALDGTWHRPFTTFELAALQSYVGPEDVGFVMEGQSDSAWRERIGNMVPPAAAEAVMGVIARTLLLAQAGETFMLSSEPIWVQPIAIAASLDLPLTPAAAE